MGMYCACGVKKIEEWKCECDWKFWFACFENKDIPSYVQIKSIPEKDGIYLVRVFDEGDYNEEESEFCKKPKNWGEYTNKAISSWKIEYTDNWTGYRGVYAWKEPVTIS